MRRIAWLLASLAVAAGGCRKLDPEYCSKNPGVCDGDGGVIMGDGANVAIGGTVTGLTGAGLVLENNGMDDKAIVGNGAFQFPSLIPVNSTYDVLAKVQPSNPSQNCTIAGGTGTATTDVSSVDVTCMTQSYAISGTILGLSSTVMLSLDVNGTPVETITKTSGATTFAFTMMVPSGATYAVNSNLSSCRVSGGNGTMGDADVTTVVVNCSTSSFTIGGSVAGLNGTVKLHNGNDTISVSSNSAFAFPTPVPQGGSYNVTVSQQPGYPPANQTCTIPAGMGSGSNVQGDIVGIQVNCVTNSFTVGGGATGVNGTVVLQNNGTDNLTLNQGNSSFTFATKVQSGAAYLVTVMSEPASLSCSLSRSSGTVGNGNVTNVGVTCGYRDPGVYCGSSTCNGGNGCCDPEGTASCTPSSQCSQFFLPCDSTADCQGGSICCAHEDKHGRLQNVSCTSMGCGGVMMCDPKVFNPCPFGGSCQAYGQLNGYYACQ